MWRNYFDVSDEDVLDWLKWRFKISSDKDLAILLKTSASTISKIRGKHTPIGSVVLLKILDLTGVRLRDFPSLIKSTKSIDK